MLSKGLLNPKAWIYTLQEQANFFLGGQKCVDRSGSYFDP